MTDVVGDTIALQESFVATWLQRAEDKVQSSPAGHVAEMVRQALRAEVLRPVDGSTSDGFHTFDELYRHRALLNAALFNAWHLLDGEGIGCDYRVYKSRQHAAEDTDPMFPGMFKTGATLDGAAISYHYPLAHWDLFKIPELERAPVWDLHTAGDSAARLEAFLS